MLREIHATVDVIVEWLGREEDGRYTLRKVRSEQKVIADVERQSITLHAKPVSAGSLRVESLGHFLERTLHIRLKPWIGRCKYVLAEFFPTIADVFAQHLHSLRIIAVVAHGQHVCMQIAFTLAGAYMEVIAGVHRLLTARGKEDSKMRLEGRLIIRESCVAIDPISAVAQRKTRYLRVILPDFVDELQAELIPL